MPARVLPLPRQTLAPSVPIARARIGGDSGERAAVEVLFAAWELARAAAPERPGGGSWVEGAAGRLAALSGLLAAEVQRGWARLEERALVEVERAADGRERLRVAPEVLCDLPALSELAGDAVRARLQREGTLPPALAVLREVARRAGAERSSPVRASVDELAGDTLYGRTAVKQALAQLERAGLLRRTLAGRQMELTLTAAAFEPGAAPPPSDRAPGAPGGASAETVLLTPGGVTVELAPGSRLRVGAGATCEVEIDGQGRTVLRIS